MPPRRQQPLRPRPQEKHHPGSTLEAMAMLLSLLLTLKAKRVTDPLPWERCWMLDSSQPSFPRQGILCE